MKERLIELFGESWYEVLSSYLHSKEFMDLGLFINNRRKVTTVYPEQHEVFKSFIETPFHKTNVIVLGLDPYNDGTACGLSFCCCKKFKPNPSLKNIMTEIDLEYPDNYYHIGDSRLDLLDLQRWCNQGILMLNSALTVEKGLVKSHLTQWNQFTIEVIKALNKKEYVVWLLLGKDAQQFEKYISTRHGVVAHIHPAAISYNPNLNWFNSGIFKEVNELLRFNNLNEILW